MPIFSKLFFFHILCFLYVYQPFSIPIRFLPREWLVCEVLTWGGGRRIIIYWEILKEPKKEKVCQNRLVMNVRSMEPSRLCHICILYFCQNALPVLLNLLQDVWGRNEKVIDRTQTSNSYLNQLEQPISKLGKWKIYFLCKVRDGGSQILITSGMFVQKLPSLVFSKLIWV